ncbi:hypothetical protein [Streptomyces sp. NPDC089915]|uniref:hypothetical protein n=1 Tax=Streptomyces sp. NPDC089915 TaxID=3155186 RepID=UPI00343CDFA6
MSRTRGAWNTKGTWIAGVALAAVLALTGYAALSGDDSAPAGSGKDAGPSAGAGPSRQPAPAPTYTVPKDWTDPQRWASLPRGARTDERGSAVGFPHTFEGAVAMLTAVNKIAVGDGKTSADEQMRIYNSYVNKPDQSGANADMVRQNAQETDKQLAQEMGGPGSKTLPAGAYMRTSVVGFKVLTRSDDEVCVWVLTRGVQRNGETAKESAGYSRRVVAAQWVDGDWKMTAAASSRAQQAVQGKSEPAMVAPGDQAFNEAGWTAIREAS